MNDIIKIGKSLKGAGLLEFLGILAATLAVSLLECELIDKGVVRGGDGLIQLVEWTYKVAQDW